jgi:hypothetical protein
MQTIADETLDDFSLHGFTRSAKASIPQGFASAGGWESRKPVQKAVMKKLFPATLVALFPFAKASRPKRYFSGAVICLFLCSALGFSACRTLSTTAGAPPTGPVNGMVYYLPIGKITIKGEFKSDGSTGRSPLTNAAALPGAKSSDGEESSQGGITISGGGLTITLVSEVEADETAGQYYVSPRANYMYEDETRVTVNSKHLLSTGNVTTEDKTADIVGALASLAAQAVTLTGGPSPAPSATPTPTPPFYFSFHPSNSTEVGDVTTALANRGIYFAVTSKRQPAGSDSKGLQSVANAQRLGQGGLIFRSAVAYKVALRYPNAINFDTSSSIINTAQQFILPDPNRLYEVKYNRMAFVKKLKEIGFRDGMLTEFHEKVPSPILGFLGIPKAILQAVVPIPGAPAGGGSASATGTSPPTN